MTALYLYDDARARAFEPFALTRPVSELRAGVELVRRRWESALGTRAAGAIVAPHLSDFSEEGAPAAVRAAVPAGSIIANSRFVPALARLKSNAKIAVWTSAGRVAAVRIARELPESAMEAGSAALASLLPPGAASVEIAGRWLDDVWQLVTTLLPTLREDIEYLGPTLSCIPVERASVVGTHAVYVEKEAVIEPFVLFDVSAGPVLVRGGAIVRAFTRLVGPCAIAAGAHVLGDRVHGCSIGEGSVVRGEISESIVIGNANKGHEGFVGHSVLGRWVNLGAGTITSNLKNTYGDVSFWTPEGERETGTIKLGTFFGDHVKTGIGARFMTGSVVGAGSNVYGSTMPPRYVPPFSWGEGGSLGEYRLAEFLRTVERAMERRGMKLSDGARRQLSVAHTIARGVGRR